MGKRPTPHVDTSANEAPSADFTPSYTPATNATKHVNVCVYGDNGTGKTRFAGTFPKPIVLALDPGYTVLRQLPNADDIHVVRIPDPAREGVPTLKQVWDYYQWLLAGEHDRQTVVVDSITELHKIILDAVMARPRAGRESATVPCTDDYVEVGAKLKSLIRYFRDLPMNVVFTAHHKVLKKKDDVIGIRPDLSEKLSTELGGACDVVMYTTVIEKEIDGQQMAAYMGQTVPFDGVQAKDRSGRLRTPATPLHWDRIAEAFGIGSSVAKAPEQAAPVAPDVVEYEPLIERLVDLMVEVGQPDGKKWTKRAADKAVRESPNLSQAWVESQIERAEQRLDEAMAARQAEIDASAADAGFPEVA